MAKINAAGAVTYDPGREPEGHAQAAEDGAEQVTPPPPSAPKAAWVEHAVAAAGVAPDEAAAMTKAQLQETVQAAAPPAPPSPPRPPADMQAQMTVTAEATVTKGNTDD